MYSLCDLCVADHIFYSFSEETQLSDAGNNNRPVQPWNGREVRLSTGFAAEPHVTKAADDDENSPASAGQFYGE